MRQSREATAETHQAIVDTAATLFRARGVSETSIGDVMQAAGRTHGGFYRHFDSKEALLAAAISAAFEAMTTRLLNEAKDAPPAAVPAGFRASYLSDRDLASAESGCPVAALAGDFRHATPALKEQFGRGVEHLVDALGQAMDGDRKAAIRLFAQGVGAMMIARAVDSGTAREILDACREA